MIGSASLPTVGTAGFLFVIYVTDAVGTRMNISGYTTLKQLRFTSPAGVETVKSASFYSDGTDGGLVYSTESGMFTAAGTWRVRAHLVNGSVMLDTPEESFFVRGQ